MGRTACRVEAESADLLGVAAEYLHVKRAHNEPADRLVNDALDAT